MLSESLRCSFGDDHVPRRASRHHWPCRGGARCRQTTERQCSVRHKPVDDLSGHAPTSSPARSSPNPSSTEVSYTFGLMTRRGCWSRGHAYAALRASVYSVSASFRQAPRIGVQARNFDLPGPEGLPFHPAASASLAPARPSHKSDVRRSLVTGCLGRCCRTFGATC